jgi:alkylhydroperoxidase family enzyme
MKRSELSEFEPLFAMAESVLGFLPNSMLIMGREPEVLYSFSMLTGSVLREEARMSPIKMLWLTIKQIFRIIKRQKSSNRGIDAELKWLLAYASSSAAECRYCQAHTSHSAHQAGVAIEKITEIWNFETHPLFSDSERAALRVAFSIRTTPDKKPRNLIKELCEHFNESEATQIIAVIALFGFLNRWNALLDTPLEDAPGDFYNTLTG